MKVKTNLVKWFLQVSKFLRDAAEASKTRRLFAIVAEKEAVLMNALEKRIAIEKQLEAMRKTAEKAKIKATEKANNKHEILEGEFTELEKL